jgi:hypothetical protein
MTISNLENWSDKLLFLIIKELKRSIDLDSINNSADYSFTEAVATISSLFSINNDHINCDYLYNIWVLNEDSFEGKTLNGSLKRPTLKKYTYDYRERQSVITDTYYTNEISMYTETDGVIDILYNLKSEGVLEPWDGDQYNSETIDGEFIDDEIENVQKH